MGNLNLHVGHCRAWLLDCGCFPYDGGALFGAVPKVAWGQHYAADDQNRVKVALRPLLIQDGDGWVLVDTGLPAGEPDGEDLRPVAAAMAEAGVAPEAVTSVVLTHLHPDHVGGDFATDGDLRPAFPNALFYAQREEAAAASFPNERTRADYDDRHVRRLERAGVLRTVSGTYRLSPHVTLLPSAGHTPGHQCVLLADGDAGALYVSDLAIFPVQAERLTWISALDTQPMVSLESKRELLGRAVAEGWQIVFEHEPDPLRAVGKLVPTGRRWRFIPDPPG
jgi:glyoxylase-like metal-dependent hydrolase (beta-lactamase superfamily II)